MRKTAAEQKTYVAEKQIAIVRALVIVAGTFTFFLLEPEHLNKTLAYSLMAFIWPYGIFVLYFRPYEKYPILFASWFTYLGDCLFACLWLYATGGVYSPYHAVLYVSIIAVAYRFDLRTILFTATLYMICYLTILLLLGQLGIHIGDTIVRMSFFYIIGFMTHQITNETLNQTQQKLELQQLAEESRQAHELLEKNERALAITNEHLQMRNRILSHAEENAAIGSYAWNLDTEQLEYSDNFFRLLGHQPGDFRPSFQKYLSFIHPEDRERANAETMRTVKEHEPLISRHRLITRDGRLRFMRATGRIITEYGVSIMIGTLQDITEEHALSEKLYQKNRELEESNAQLASFNYVASHDLQEPVRKIQTFSNLILQQEKEGISETALNYIQKIRTSASRMQSLIQAFLNYSRIASEHSGHEQTDLNMLLHEVIADVQDQIEEHHARIHVEALPTLRVSPLQLQQVFINLITNAIKYAKENEPPQITITANKISGRELQKYGADPAAKFWQISVEDNGIGFDNKYSEKIFEVFQRLHGKDKYEGSGIGLAICRKIMQLHKGYIDVSSMPGTGSVFHIYLPANNTGEDLRIV